MEMAMYSNELIEHNAICRLDEKKTVSAFPDDWLQTGFNNFFSIKTSNLFLCLQKYIAIVCLLQQR